MHALAALNFLCIGLFNSSKVSFAPRTSTVWFNQKEWREFVTLCETRMLTILNVCKPMQCNKNVADEKQDTIVLIHWTWPQMLSPMCVKKIQKKRIQAHTIFLAPKKTKMVPLPFYFQLSIIWANFRRMALGSFIKFMLKPALTRKDQLYM